MGANRLPGRLASSLNHAAAIARDISTVDEVQVTPGIFRAAAFLPSTVSLCRSAIVRNRRELSGSHYFFFSCVDAGCGVCSLVGGTMFLIRM